MLMARPRKLQCPVKLNLLVDERSKKRAKELATAMGLSVGRMFEELIRKECVRAHKEVGSGATTGPEM